MRTLRLQFSNMQSMRYVWVFVARRGRFPGGVFETLAEADTWISNHSLSGVLTSYEVGIGCYEQAMRDGTFNPNEDQRNSPDFIGAFSSASQEHYHYEDGRRH